MNEIKKPKKPLIFYYGIALAIMLLFNLFAMPQLIQQRVKEVDYGTFMSMTEKRKSGLLRFAITRLFSLIKVKSKSIKRE